MKKITFISFMLCLFITLTVSAKPSAHNRVNKKELTTKERISKIKGKRAAVQPVAKATNGVVLYEDFSKFTAGSEAAPDGTDITDFTTGEIPAEYTQTAGWAGYGVYQAGGLAYIGLVWYEDEEGEFEDTGFIDTPERYLSTSSGNFTVKFRAKSESVSGDELHLIWYDAMDETGEVYQEQVIQITNTWQEYEIKCTGGYNATRVQFWTISDPWYLDDVNIEPDGLNVGEIQTPVATNATNVGFATFTANWGAVEGASGYDLNVYTKEEGQGLATVFSENFNSFAGTGGNDDLWDGAAANTVATALDGWSFTNVFQGKECIKAGTASKQGVVTMPLLTELNGDAVLTFRAGAWNNPNEQTELTLEISGGGSLDQTSVTMVKGAFSDYTVNIIGGTPTTKITFKGKQDSNSRFFLDDVAVTQDGTTLISKPITGSPFAVTGTSYEVTGLTPETTYYYTVVAKNETGTSAKSNEISVTTTAESGIDFSVVKNSIFVNGNLHVVLDSADVIEVYTISGVLVNRTDGKAGDNEIALPQQGIYVVKTGKAIAKVVK